MSGTPGPGEVAILHKFETGWGWAGTFRGKRLTLLVLAAEKQAGRRLSFRETMRMGRFQHDNGTDADYAWFLGLFPQEQIGVLTR